MSGEGDPFQPLRIYSWAELKALELPELEWAVDEILPLGALTMLAGREKSGKSLMTIDLCCSVALGEPFLGRGVKQGPTIMVPAEDNVREVRSRIQERLGEQDAENVLVCPVNGWGENELHLTDKAEMTALMDAIIRLKPVVVVLDPLRELHGGEENSSDQMAPTMAPLRDIPHMTNTALIINHHMNKSGGARGSTALVGAVDQYWAYHTPSDDRTDDDEVEVTGGFLRIKGRYTRRMRIDIKLGEQLRWETTDRPQVTVNEKNLPERIIKAVTESPLLTMEEIVAVTGASRSSVQRVVGVMLASIPPQIAKTGQGTRIYPHRFSAPSKS